MGIRAVQLRTRIRQVHGRSQPLGLRTRMPCGGEDQGPHLPPVPEAVSGAFASTDSRGDPSVEGGTRSEGGCNDRYVDNPLRQVHRVGRASVRAVPLKVKVRTMTQLVDQGTAETAGKVIYTAKTHTTGGRENGVSRSSDGRLDVRLSVPGSPRIGTNPEQLFAAGWSACFEGAIALVAHKKKIKLPGEVAIDAQVDLHLNSNGEYFLGARLNISIPAVDRSVAQTLINDAKGVCPYSKVTKGNIDVTYNLV